jgi:flagellar FliL protein
MTEPAIPATPDSQPGPKKTGGKRRLLLVVLALVVVLGGGGAAVVWAMRRPAGAAAAPRPAEHALVSLEPFVVNLADQGGTRFLRVSVRLIVGSLEEAERVQKNEVALLRARSAILELLTQQTAERLVTAAGKSALKQAIAARLAAVLEGITVVDVLFSDFVVQF